jgi:hypothetical protein
MSDDQIAALRAAAGNAVAADDAADWAESEGARSDELQAALNAAEDATQEYRNHAPAYLVLSLLDRLAQAERERDEVVREKVMATQASQRLMAERDALRGLLKSLWFDTLREPDRHWHPDRDRIDAALAGDK